MINQFLVKLHKPFNFIEFQLFKYLVNGCIINLTDIVLFYIIFSLLKPISAYAENIAFLSTAIVIFPLGFYLSKYITFENKSEKSKKQIINYLLLVVFCYILGLLIFNLLIAIKLLPLLAKVITTIIVVITSYLFQKLMVFKNND